MNQLLEAAMKLRQGQAMLGEACNADAAGSRPNLSSAINLLERAIEKVKKEAFAELARQAMVTPQAFADAMNHSELF
jgi:hypothetical protein